MPAEVLTGDKKNLVVANYAKWHISGPLKFMRTVANENGAQARLDDIVYSKMREVIGKVSLSDVISGHRDSVMSEVMLASREKASDYGTHVLDVRIKRADLREENERYVFARMQAERERQANLYRSEGRQEAEIIRAQTDKEKEIILAEAFSEAETLKGRGESEAKRIYAEAYGKDPEFYAFSRALEAYETSLDEHTVVVLPSEGEFLAYMEGGTPKR
jgi:membrane protease subunit HflC